VWWDREVAAGESFAQEIEEALEEARGVVVLWSHSSVESPWVQAEANEGLERRVLIPVWIEDCEPPLVFRTVQTADLTGWEWDRDDPRLVRFVADAGRILPASGEAPAATPAPPQPVPGGFRRWAPLIGAVALVIAAGGWWGFRHLGAQRQRVLAQELMAHSTALLQGVLTVAPEERGTYWWRLLELGDRASRLERSVLLALEAARRVPSAEATEALEKGLRLLTRPILEVPCGGISWNVAWLPDGSGVAVALQDGGIEVWSLGDGQSRGRRFTGDRFSAVAACPEGLVLWGADGSVRVWDPVADRDVARWGPATGNPVGFAPGGRWSVVGGAPGVAVVEVLSGKETGAVDLEAPDGLAGPVLVATVSADGRQVALAGRAGVTGIWRIPGRSPANWIRPGVRVEALAFSPDGTALAAACADAAVRVTQVATEREILILEHGARVIDVSFSPDGALLASASQDTTARVWDVETGSEVARLTHWDNVNGVWFSPDGRNLATASQERLARVWRVRCDDPAAEACSRLSRNLTPEEWKQYLGDAPYRKTCPELP